MRRQLNTFVIAAGSLLILSTTMSANAQVARQPRVLDPAEAAAIMATGKSAPAEFVAAVANPETAVPAQICFTCGGDWPIFAGAYHAVNTGNLTFERGSACSGTLQASNDTNPFLCTR